MINRAKKSGFAVPAGVAALALAVALLLTISPGAARSKFRGAQENGGAVAQSKLEISVGSGVEGFGQAPQEVVLDNLPQMTAKQLAAEAEGDRPLNGLSDEEYRALKKKARELGEARRAAFSRSGGQLQPAPLPLGPSITTIPLTPDFGAHQQTAGLDGVPPDLAIAVSNSYVVEVVNNSISVFTKAGVLKPGYPKSTDTLFTPINSPPFTGYTTDPRGFYDWVNHHFVFTMLTETNPSNPIGPSNVGSLMIAVSQTADPTGTWFVYNPAFKIGNTSECPDFDTLGQDSTNWGTGATMGGIYVGINQFGTTGYCAAPPAPAPTFLRNYFIMIPKDALYKGAPFSFWTQSGLAVNNNQVDTLQAVNASQPGDRPAAVLIVNSENINFSFSGSEIDVWSASNPFGFLSGMGSPVFTGQTVNTVANYSMPPDADEPNGVGGVCVGCLDTGDVRFSGAASYHAGDIWASLNTSSFSSPTATFIYYDLHPVLDPFGNLKYVIERNEGCLNACGGSNPHNASWFYATVQPDSENNLIIAHDFSSDINFPSAGVASRRVNLDNGLYGSLGVYWTGKATIPCAAAKAPCRWGDYTATAVDLTIPNLPSMWLAAQYANRAGAWGTAIVQGRYLRPTDQ